MGRVEGVLLKLELDRSAIKEIEFRIFPANAINAS
jgi:hypothetical protein